MNNWFPQQIAPEVFAEELLDFVPEPIMIVNEQGQLLFVNARFLNLVQKTKEELIGLDYGEALGCKYFVEEETKCGSTYYCEICEIRKTLEEKASGFANPELKNGQIIIRDILINGVQSTKIFELSVKPFESEGKKYFVCLFKNLKKEDLENLESR